MTETDHHSQMRGVGHGEGSPGRPPGRPMRQLEFHQVCFFLWSSNKHNILSLPHPKLLITFFEISFLWLWISLWVCLLSLWHALYPSGLYVMAYTVLSLHLWILIFFYLRQLCNPWTCLLFLRQVLSFLRINSSF